MKTKYLIIILSTIILSSCAVQSKLALQNAKPVILHKEHPIYPDAAKKNNLKGRVTVLLTIDELGKVLNVEVLKSDNPIFNESALEAAKKCKFSPAYKDGKPYKVKLSMPFDFGYN